MMQRTIVSLETKQIAILKDLAEKMQTTMTALVREAVNQFTANIESTPAQQLLDIFEEKKDILKKGFVKNDDPNLSQNIDHYLYGSPKKIPSR